MTASVGLFPCLPCTCPASPLSTARTAEVTCLAFSADGRRLATAGRDATVRLWDTLTWQEVFTRKVPAAEVTCVTFSPDGHTLVTGHEDGAVRL